MKLRSFMIAVAVAVAAAGLQLAPPAGAQQGEGIINLEAAHPAGTSVHFIVRVTWENDGHPATDSVVTATARDSNGTELTPVTLAPIDDEGRYANAIDFGSPGTWMVRFASSEPTATSEVTATVEGRAASDDDGGGDDSGEGGFAPADDDTGASAVSSSDDAGDSGMPIWLVVAAAVVVFGGAFLGLRTVRRYRKEASSEEAQFADLEAARTAAKASDGPGDAPPGPKAEA
jgi:hypothetical protein